MDSNLHGRVRSSSTPSPCGIAATAFCAALAACSDVERQTVDRIEDHDPSAWTSANDCEDTAPSRTSTRPPRVGAWNIRYFPDSEEGEPQDPEDGTDVEWLSCAVASLEVDVLAVQEFKNTPRALEKRQELVEALNRRTGGDWKLETAPCKPEDVQHPGFLYDASRVTGTAFRELPAMNPYPECSNDASPGFAGYFAIEGGPDFHFVSTHLHSGTSQQAIEGRAQAIAVMPRVAAEAQAVAPDTDVLFAGDFNTSGCDECSPVVTSTDEIGGIPSKLLHGESAPLRLVEASERCSREDGDQSYLLDHFAAANAMQEVPAEAVVQVSGFCSEGACDRLRLWHEDARARLSDHCPILLDLAADDDD